MIVTGCYKEGPVGPQGPAGSNSYSDKQIRFELGNFPTAVDTIISTPENSLSYIQQFNINNYPGVDSAILLIYDIKTFADCCSGFDTISNASFELYDLTNNIPIANSRIVSDNIPDGTFVISKNFIKDLPNQTIDIGVRIITERDVYSHTGNVYFFLYRK